jgi:hypothetical protein
MRSLLAAGACALALGASACGGHDDSPPATAATPAPLTGVHTQITPSGALKGAGVTLGAIAPATSGSTGVVLPITGGSVNLDTLAGTIQQGGGLKYTGKGKTAELTAILIDTSAKQLSADVGSGGDVPVMDLQLGPLNQTGGMIQADVTLTLTSEGQQALGIDGLKSGMTMGTGVIHATAG